MNEKIFKDYDIRGVYGQDFDENDTYQIGLSYATMRRDELKKDGLNIAVAMDMRISSPILKEKLVEGLLDGGMNVIDIGLASTPTFYFTVANYGYDGGIIVSASHNPKEYNGFKLTREKALPIGQGTGMETLKNLVLSESQKKTSQRGTVSTRENVLLDQLIHDLKYADIPKIKKFKIVIDTANSMGALYFEELFKNLNCDIIKMNWELDGTFPAHEADPLKAENMQTLCEKVISEKADLGIATDGDGDRIFFADEKGGIIEPGITRAILSRIFLRANPSAKIAYDVRPGKITPDIILENGGTPIVTRVGHSLIKAQAIKEGAVFAGESSGHFFLNMPEGCYEIPVIVTLKILEELSTSGQTFSEYAKPFNKYFHSGEINSRVENPLEKIAEIKEKYANGKQNELDGITVEYSNFWFNVRASNTEPLLRLNLEATSQEIMVEKRDELMQLIKN